MWRAVQIAGLTILIAACASAPYSPRPTAPLSTAARSSTSSSLQARIVGGAEAMLGQPYRWGGAAPGGFDCSGLVVYAMNGAGIQVPRTAHEQLEIGAPVSRRALRAGDLVFLHLARKDLHVGIAIDHDRFVHAPSRGGFVRIDSLAAPPYAQSFLTARRVVGGGTAPRAGAAAAVESHPGPTPLH